MDANQKEEIMGKAREAVDKIQKLVIETINALDSTVQPNEPAMDVVRRWEALKALMSAVKAAADPEMVVRKQAFALLFPEPKEGTNTAELGGGWKIKGVHKIDRKLDEATLPDTITALRDAGVLTDRLIEYKPQLSISEFRELTEEQAAILAGAMTEKPASPSLELVPPKNRA